MLLKKLDDHSYAMFCPACQDLHVIGEEWEFTGTLEKPSFHPSVYRWEPEYVCHFFIHDGMLLFLPDCTHEYADMTLRMPPLPDWFVSTPESLGETDKVDCSDTFYYPDDPEKSDFEPETANLAPSQPDSDDYWTEID